MRQMLLLAGALFLFTGCDDLFTDTDEDDEFGSYSLVRFNDRQVPVKLTLGDVCNEDELILEELDVRGGSAVVVSDSIIRAELDILFRCGPEDEWAPSDETRNEFRYERDGNSLVISERHSPGADWREMGTGQFSQNRLTLILQVGDGEGDILNLEFVKD